VGGCCPYFARQHALSGTVNVNVNELRLGFSNSGCGRVPFCDQAMAIAEAALSALSGGDVSPATLRACLDKVGAQARAMLPRVAAQASRWARPCAAATQGPTDVARVLFFTLDPSGSSTPFRSLRRCALCLCGVGPPQRSGHPGVAAWPQACNGRPGPIQPSHRGRGGQGRCSAGDGHPANPPV
jgi:hypothetical protein